MTRTRRREKPVKEISPVVNGGLQGGQYKPLSDEQMELIVSSAKKVLWRTGVEIMESNCRTFLEGQGCRVDTEKNRVYFPEELIDKALSTMAPTVLLAGREEKHDLVLGGANVYMGTGGAAVNMLDLDGKIRNTTLQDNYNIGRLCDKLDNIHFYMRPVTPRDVGNDVIDINSAYACLSATKKHVMSNIYEPSSAKDIRKLGELLVGGKEEFDKRPPVSLTACWTVSPLRYAMETVEVLDAIIEQDIPVVISTAPQAGATSPAALAGSLVQIIAEQLSGIVYVNLMKPGYPLIMGCVPAQADLRTGAFTGGSGEFSLLHACCAQLSQYLKIPIYNSSGISDSKEPDAQAGMEKGITGVTAALAGSNYIHHSAGFLESLLTVAFEQYVIDNDINGEIMRILKGIDFSEESLSLDVIDEVCNGIGHYLGHPQTIALMNTEYLYPEVMDRSSREDWNEAGKKDVRQRAKEYATSILENHFPKVIPDEIDAEIRKQFNIVLDKEKMEKFNV